MTKDPLAEVLEPYVIEPCRFCSSGGDFLDIAKPRGHAKGESFVFCRECKSAGPTGPTVEKAIHYWNNGWVPRRKEETKP